MPNNTLPDAWVSQNFLNDLLLTTSYTVNQIFSNIFCRRHCLKFEIQRRALNGIT